MSAVFNTAQFYCVVFFWSLHVIDPFRTSAQIPFKMNKILTWLIILNYNVTSIHILEDEYTSYTSNSHLSFVLLRKPKSMPIVYLTIQLMLILRLCSHWPQMKTWKKWWNNPNVIGPTSKGPGCPVCHKY